MNAYARQIEPLNVLGPRLPGGPAHRMLVENVTADLASLAYHVECDTHTGRFRTMPAGARIAAFLLRHPSRRCRSRRR